MRIEAGILPTLLLAGCAITIPLPDNPPANAAGPAMQGRLPSDMTAEELSRYMADVATWPADRQAAEIRRLQAGPLAATDRLELGWLLARKGAGPEDIAQAKAVLMGLENEFQDATTRQWVLLLQRVLALEAEVRQEHSRAAALQDKIDRLKDLERDLHDRAKTEPAK